MKKLILTLLWTLSILLPTKTFAQNPEPYAVLSEGNTKLTFYYDTQKDANGGMSVGPFQNYADERGWHEQRNNITNVVIDASMANYTGLTSTHRWFEGFSNLTSIIGLENLKMDGVTITGNMFDGCSSLTSLDLSSWNTENVTYLGSMFDNCSSLKEINLSGWKVGSVTYMNYMFSNCSSLVTIYVDDNWMLDQTGQVTGWQYVFNGCESLVGGNGTHFDSNHIDTGYAHIDGGTANPGYFTDISLPQPYAVLSEGNTKLTFYYDNQKFVHGGMSVGPFTGNYDPNTGQYVDDDRGWYDARESITTVEFDESFKEYTDLTSTAYWFNRCHNLSSIKKIENLKTGKVEDMMAMFYECSSLSNLDVKGFDTGNAVNLQYMFYGCDGLTSLDVSGFNTSKVQIFFQMFAQCTGLASLDVSGFNTESAVYMNYMFSGCSSLTALDVSGFDTGNVTDMGFMFNGCSKLTALDVSGFDTGNVTSMEAMFANCSGLTSLDVATVATEKVTTMYAMFYGCSSLTELNLQNFKTANVKNLDMMFQFCSGLTSIDVSGFNTGNAENISQMFCKCSGLTSLDLSNFNTEKVTKMSAMFSECSALTSINLSSFNTSAIADIYGLFNMFYGCSSLTTLDLSSFNTSTVPNMIQMFFNCGNLETIYVGDKWTTENVTSSDDMFTYCYNLKGGQGTTYDVGYIDAAYAHIDEGATNPGYLTDKNASDAIVVDLINNGDMEGDDNSSFYFINHIEASTPSKVTITNGTGVNGSRGIKIEAKDRVNDFWDNEFWFLYNQPVSEGTRFKLSFDYRADNSATAYIASHEKYTEWIYDWPEWIYDWPDPYIYFSTEWKNYTYEGVVSSIISKDQKAMGSLFFDLNQTPAANTYYFDNVKFEVILKDQCPKPTFSQKSHTVSIQSPFNATIYYTTDGSVPTTSSTVYASPLAFSQNAIVKAIAVVEGYEVSPVATYTFEYKEPYAVLSEENTVLTFYYDDKKTDNGGMDIGPFANFSDRPWNGNQQAIIEVVFDDSFANYTGLTSTAHWFENFTSLNSVQGIENLKTANVTDMSYMFYLCMNLEHLAVDGFNTSNVTDMQYMFGSCSKLKDLELQSFNTENVTNMKGMFTSCEQLTGLDLSSFNTAKVTDMTDMFYQCGSLTTLLVPNFNTAQVTGMGSMFYNCSGLTTLDVTSFNTAKVTDMSSMFNRCLTLTTLNVSSFDVGNVLDFGGMFVGCTGLTELDLSNFDTHSATRMAGMFAGCENLTKIYASEKWDNSHVTSGDDMFENCYNLKGGQGTVYAQDRRGVSYAHIDGGENNPGYFTDKNAPAVAEPYAVLDGNVLVFYYDTDKNAIGGMDIGPFATRFERGWNDDAGTITKVEFDESFAQYTGLTSTAYWFFDCNNLVAIDGLENLKTDEVTSMREMFMYCDKLTSLNLSSFNTTHVHDMSDMFYGCESLTILDLSSFYTLNVTDMSGMFFKNAMSVLDLSSFNTANVTNMMGMFRMCPYLTTIYVSDGWTTDNVTNGNEMFMGCQNLKGGQGTEFTQAYMGVEYAHIDGGASNPGYLTDKNAPVVLDEIMAYGVLTDQMKKMTLYYDKNMASHTEGMTLPWGELLNGYEYNHARETLVTIDIDPSFANFNTLESSGYIFAGCMKLTAIHGLQYFVTDHMTKMQEMFASCESLTELDLSSFNTSHVTEMFAMFQGCSHLKTIIVGPGWTTAALTDEGHEMFAGCTSLVGEKGTTYSEPNFNADYAHIDGGPSNPGYLTGANVPDITEFEVDGIWYRVRQKGDHEVTVVRVMYAEEERFVPSEVQYENIHWHVTALGEKAFADLHNVAVIGVPSSIDDISVDLFNHCDHLAAIMWETNVPLTSAAMGEFNNPNLLLFMANKAGAPAGVTNIIDMSTFTADKIVLTDSESGGNDFYCPETFKANEISYTHVYDQATKIGACQGWESIVLPFDVQTFTHETKGEIYPIASLLDEQIEYDGDKPFWLYEFTQQDEFVEADKIMANRPYIISMPNDPAYWDDYILKGRITFSAKNAEIYPTHEPMVVESKSRVFVPNYANADYQNPDVFLLNVGDAYDGHLPGSVFSSERPNRIARPFEAYFVPTGNYPAKRYMDIFDTEVDAIREIPMAAKAKEGIYDLTGRKVEDGQLTKGVYIIDGKKVMVK